MDRVDKYIARRQRLHVSEPVSIRDFQLQWENVLRSHYDIKPTASSNDNVAEKIMHSMNIEDEDLLDSLRYDCRPKSLDCDLGDIAPISQLIRKFDMEQYKIRNKDVDLATIKSQETDLLKRIKNISYHKHSLQYWRSNYFDTIAMPNKAEETRDIQDNEVILEVEVYRPAKLQNDIFRDKSKNPCYRNLVSFISDRYNVLGSQKLTDLRDVINCFSDLVGVRDESDPNQKPAPKAKDIYKSGFIYINGVFYNDLRDPENKDYSRTIIEWAKTKTPDVGPYKMEAMEKTTFLDLNIRLSYPYVYQHQGDCEHILVFNNVRMINKEDSQTKQEYPLPIMIPHRYKTDCMICTTKSATWVTIGNERVYEDPFYFCETCFKAYNYTKEGEKIGNFKAYRIHLK